MRNQKGNSDREVVFPLQKSNNYGMYFGLGWETVTGERNTELTQRNILSTKVS